MSNRPQAIVIGSGISMAIASALADQGFATIELADEHRLLPTDDVYFVGGQSCGKTEAMFAMYDKPYQTQIMERRAAHARQEREAMQRHRREAWGASPWARVLVPLEAGAEHTFNEVPLTKRQRRRQKGKSK